MVSEVIWADQGETVVRTCTQTVVQLPWYSRVGVLLRLLAVGTVVVGAAATGGSVGGSVGAGPVVLAAVVAAAAAESELEG